MQLETDHRISQAKQKRQQMKVSLLLPADSLTAATHMRPMCHHTFQAQTRLIINEFTTNDELLSSSTLMVNQEEDVYQYCSLYLKLFLFAL